MKEQRNRDKSNSIKHQEKQYKDNFWEFSKKVCRGQIDENPKRPTFDKITADNFYPSTYSTPPIHDPSKLNWFPYLPDHQRYEFNLSPITPKDVKSIIS